MVMSTESWQALTYPLLNDFSFCAPAVGRTTSPVYPAKDASVEAVPAADGHASCEKPRSAERALF